MNYFECTLSRGDIALLIDALLTLKFKCYYEEIELQGEGKSTAFVRHKIDLIEEQIQNLDSRL